MIRKKVIAVMAVFLSVLPWTAWSSLTTIGTGTINGVSGDYNLIYDDVLDITWLDYTKSGNDWYNQVSWADSLVVSFNGQKYDDWRLPETFEDQANMNGGVGHEGPDASGYHNYREGYNMVNSEIGRLFYEDLGNKGYIATDGTNPSDYGLENTGDFENLVESWYWGTEYSVDLGRAWVFNIYSGGQGLYGKGWYDDGHGLAVRSGDVSVVPEPTTWLLFGVGLLGLCLLGFRKNEKWNFKL